MKQEFVAEIKGRDEIRLILENGKASWSAVGCLSLLRTVKAYAAQVDDSVHSWPLPEGHGHTFILLREIILKAKGEWDFPVELEELCHCRQIATCKVDRAIVAGAHSAEKVSQQTSAGTACGTCRFQTEKLIEFRLAPQSRAKKQAA